MSAPAPGPARSPLDQRRQPASGPGSVSGGLRWQAIRSLPLSVCTDRTMAWPRCLGGPAVTAAEPGDSRAAAGAFRIGGPGSQAASGARRQVVPDKSIRVTVFTVTVWSAAAGSHCRRLGNALCWGCPPKLCRSAAPRALSRDLPLN